MFKILFIILTAVFTSHSVQRGGRLLFRHTFIAWSHVREVVFI